MECIRQVSGVHSAGQWSAFGRSVECIRQVGGVHSAGRWNAFGRSVECVRQVGGMHPAGRWNAFGQVSGSHWSATFHACHPEWSLRSEGPHKRLSMSPLRIRWGRRFRSSFEFWNTVRRDVRSFAVLRMTRCFESFQAPVHGCRRDVGNGKSPVPPSRAGPFLFHRKGCQPRSSSFGVPRTLGERQSLSTSSPKAAQGCRTPRRSRECNAAPRVHAQ